jgi:hypothetical protein
LLAAQRVRPRHALVAAIGEIDRKLRLATADGTSGAEGDRRCGPSRWRVLMYKRRRVRSGASSAGIWRHSSAPITW